jgi:hypothetical protein
MVVWFAYMVSPLGPSIRLKKTFHMGVQDEDSIELKRRLCDSFYVQEVNMEDLEGKYEIAKLDPDLTDVVSEGVVEIYYMH